MARAARKKPADAASGAEPEAPALSVVDSKAAPDAFEDGEKIKNWAGDEESDAYESAKKIYKDIVRAFENKQDQSQDNEAHWNIYNAVPDDNQQYSGNSTCYIPTVRDCLNARAKRCIKQLFPASHRHVEAISADADIPWAQISLLEHYIRKTRLKDTVRCDLLAGDVTGQWNLYADWTKSYRPITKIVRKPPMIEQIAGEDVSDLGLDDPSAEGDEELESENIIEEGPDIVCFDTEDLAVIPPTCNDIQKSKASVMRLRMSQDAFERMVDEGVFLLPDDCDDADAWFKKLKAQSKGSPNRHNPNKKASEDAGVRTEGTDEYCLVFETHMKLNFGGAHKERAIVYFCGINEICGIIKSPYWGGKIPILSEPVDKRKGSFFGRSKIEPVKYLQWNLTDFWNMGQDSAMYALMPVFAADPLKNPNWQSMVIGLAAVWPIAPSDIKPIPFPLLYKEAAQICTMLKAQIMESLDVNEIMLGKMPQGRKNNQLMGAMQQEQQTNITDNADRYEEVMLNPLLEMLFEYDAQFRTKAITIESRGEIGAKAKMMTVEPQQWGERYFFRWVGTEFQATQNRIQQQIALANVIKGYPPALLDGHRFNAVPMLEKAVETTFGADLGPKVFIDERNTFTINPDQENEMIHNGFDIEVHEGDEDTIHLQSHMQATARAGDPVGLYKKHMAAHMKQLQKKRQKQQAESMKMMQGAPGGPGGGPPGVAGTPGMRPGAMPGQQRPAQGPPGMQHADSMPGMPGRG